jgi:hypothetical protein
VPGVCMVIRAWDFNIIPKNHASQKLKKGQLKKGCI